MSLPNLLASRWGRLTAFFFLYVTEGIPYGFATTAIVSHLRDQGHTEKELGYFSGVILLPWAFKWAVGPFVDLIYSDRLGRRRGWIVGCQLLMAVSLLACIPIDTSGGLYALTIVLTIHNCFSATQDVAIDALACGTLKSDERGLANGLMFSGAYAGQMVGASVVLHLMGGISWVPGLENGISFESTFWIVSAAILTVTVFVSLSLREQPTESDSVVRGSLNQATEEVGHYLAEAFRSVFANRTAIVALAICLLPAGSLFLGMQLHTALAKRLAYTNTELANLAFFSTVVPCIFCVIGGYLSDKVGRRFSLGVYILLTIVPTLWMAGTLYFELGWENFGSQTAKSPESIPDSVKSTFWIAVLLHSAIQGLIYGTRIAMFMDIANPDVAATQFTAYMSMQNIVLSYTAMWQGEAIARYGYPITLLMDCGIGIVAILLLPFLNFSEAQTGSLASATALNEPDIDRQGIES